MNPNSPPHLHIYHSLFYLHFRHNLGHIICFLYHVRHSGSEVVEWVSVPELGVYVTHDPPVNLASTALSGDIFHQPGSTFVKGIAFCCFFILLLNYTKFC